MSYCIEIQTGLKYKVTSFLKLHVFSSARTSLITCFRHMTYPPRNCIPSRKILKLLTRGLQHTSDFRTNLIRAINFMLLLFFV